ncbi:hypothetical protein KAFR_0B04110 [Kazachstania africana CBS 2517]|uniref:Condensation domain-containing protein n=1 Tax=Kazachstania africana (strain ATCC 22294 / BCRC 22015 / CBS 2517 / CECT 1963 / NBRC 1671 / NRRL Y-8276) TaxID=1071382 RepID=H2AQQ7_KAZAF|nr:hypothetical protein KAFR_0B04110 [Kazachstania africana CBS 2517]CCF56707.1 hypothetical protein KAFR_0B04110 [Kazachstania africana CBS 2517]
MNGASVRQLAPIEKYFYHRSDLGLHTCFYLGVELSKIPSKDKFIQALKKTIAELPLFHCNIDKGSGNSDLHAKNVQGVINFADVVEFRNDIQFLSTKEINDIFQNYDFNYGKESFLWKILVIPSQNQLLLLLDHALYDGNSGVKFWEVFMTSLREAKCNVEEQEDECIFKGDKSTDFVLEPHPYDKWPGTWSWAVKKVLAKMLFSASPKMITKIDSKFMQFKDYPFVDKLLEKPPKNGRKYQVNNDNLQWQFRLTPESLKKMLESCKKNRVSLTSYLVALFIMSLREINENKLCGGPSVNVSIPMNTRMKCKERLNLRDEEVQVGNFVTGLDFKTKMEKQEETTILNVASKVQEFITNETLNNIGDKINAMNLLNVVNQRRFLEETLNSINEGPGSVFEVTNLGFKDFDRNCDTQLNFYIKDSFFNVPKGIYSVFTCAIISTPLGGLNCTVSFPKELADTLDKPFSYVKNKLNL